MSSSGCAQTSSTVPNESMAQPRSLPNHSRSCRESAATGRTMHPGSYRRVRRLLPLIEAGVDGGEEGPEPVTEAVWDFVLGALHLDQRLEVHPKRRLVRAVVAPGEVTLHPRPDHLVDLMVQESLDLSKRVFALGPALSHRPVPVLQPSATTRAPALSFPDAD